MGDGVGVGVKLYLVCFLIFFGSFHASAVYPEKRGFSVSAPINVFRRWVFLWGRFGQEVKSSPFYPQKTFFNGPNKAIILHGSE